MNDVKDLREYYDELDVLCKTCRYDINGFMTDSIAGIIASVKFVSQEAHSYIDPTLNEDFDKGIKYLYQIRDDAIEDKEYACDALMELKFILSAALCRLTDKLCNLSRMHITTLSSCGQHDTPDEKKDSVRSCEETSSGFNGMSMSHKVSAEKSLHDEAIGVYKEILVLQHIHYLIFVIDNLTEALS